MKSIPVHLLTFGFMVSGLAAVNSSEKKLDPRLEDSDLVLSKNYVMNVSMASLAEDEQRRKAKAKEESEYAAQLRKAEEESMVDEALRESSVLSHSSMSLTGSSSDPLPLSSTKGGETVTATAAKIEEDEAIPNDIIEESIRAERDRKIKVLSAERDALSDTASSLYAVSSDLSQQIINLYAHDRPHVEPSSLPPIPCSAVSQLQGGHASSIPALSSDALNTTPKSRTPSVVAGSLSSTSSEQKSDASNSSTPDSSVVKK
jgi:hypothetical protein